VRSTDICKVKEQPFRNTIRKVVEGEKRTAEKGDYAGGERKIKTKKKFREQQGKKKGEFI